jgi:oligopeptide/dipeptide ABC transporter ATP-binding protein
VLIADEPTTALDATVQAQILSLLRRLRRERQMALLFISHDLPVVSRVCDEVLVMYAGQVLERGPAAALLESPAHPYTDALRRAIPSPKARQQGEQRPRLAAIPGSVELGFPRMGCLFAPRCSRATAECLAVRPTLTSLSAGRQAACVHPLISAERAQ